MIQTIYSGNGLLLNASKTGMNVSGIGDDNNDTFVGSNRSLDHTFDDPVDHVIDAIFYVALTTGIPDDGDSRQRSVSDNLAATSPGQPESIGDLPGSTSRQRPHLSDC